MSTNVARGGCAVEGRYIEFWRSLVEIARQVFKVEAVVWGERVRRRRLFFLSVYSNEVS